MCIRDRLPSAGTKAMVPEMNEKQMLIANTFVNFVEMIRSRCVGFRSGTIFRFESSYLHAVTSIL